MSWLTIVSGSSSAISGIPENTKLSIMLWVWSSIIVSLIFQFSRVILSRWISPTLWGWCLQQQVFAASSCCLNFIDSCSTWKSFWRIAKRASRESQLQSFVLIDFKMPTMSLVCGEASYRESSEWILFMDDAGLLLEQVSAFGFLITMRWNTPKYKSELSRCNLQSSRVLKLIKI